MTVANTLRKAGPFAGNGATTAFPFTFKVFADTDLEVIELDTTSGLETIKTITTQYTVALNADQDANPGGTVDYLTAPTAGKEVTLLSAIPALQDVDLVGGGGFYPQTIENALDRAVALIQQLQEQVLRALLIPVSFDITGSLPQPESSTVIGWNAAADALRNYSFDEISVAIAAAALLDDKGDLLVGTGGGQAPVAFSVGADGEVLVADSTEPYGVKWAPSALDGTGLVIQTVSTQVGTLASGTTQTPVDNTKPQITEGTQFLTLAFTPVSNTSVLIVDLEALVSHSGAAGTVTMALHQVGTADAIAATAVGFTTAYQQLNPRIQSYFESAVLGTGARTYSMRIGANLAGTTYLNGAGATQYYANVASTRLTITEIEPV